MLSVTISILFILIVLCCTYLCSKPKNYPPGPTWLPLVGCLPMLQRLRSKHGFVYEAFNELANTYGPILGLKLGTQNLVVISSYDVVKQALLQEEFNGRPNGFFFKLRTLGERRGILFTDENSWLQCRKFTMRHLRTFGIGKKVMKEQLTIQAQQLVNYLEKMSKYGPVLMNGTFDIAVLNSLWFMFAGHAFDYNDEKLKIALVSVNDAFKTVDNMGGLLSLMPYLRFIAPELSGYNKLLTILKRLWNFIEEEIGIHEKHPIDEPHNIIDAFLLEISKNNEDKNTIFYREFLIALCLDLFLAGSKTTSDTLTNSFLYLSLNTEWVKILQEELDNITDKSRPPTEEDLPSLPKMEAFLAELQRFLVLAPLGVPHRAMKDVSLNGYQIPKDTLILFNLHSAHHDEKHWDKPNEFHPQRFLNEKGEFCQQNSNMPFGLGKRRCLGEQLARSTLFLFFAYVIQYFNIELSADHPKPDLKGSDGFTIIPKPYYLKLTKRLDLKY